MNVVTAHGRCELARANFTRPNDTNAYSIGDVIATSTSAAVGWTIPLKRVGDVGSCILQTATLISSANVTTKLEGRLWLFDTIPASFGNDNEALTLTDAEMRTFLQVILFPSASWVAGDATSGAGGNALCNAQNLYLPINTLKESKSIFAVLEARNAYVPVAQERWDIALGLIL